MNIVTAPRAELHPPTGSARAADIRRTHSRPPEGGVFAVEDPGGDIPAIGTSGTVRGLVPLRSLGEDSKTRLRAFLSPSQRADLIAAMLVDVVDAMYGAGVTDVVVLAGDRSACALARQLGLQVSVDAGRHPGLNAAIDAASSGSVCDHDSLVVMPDLPMIKPSELDALLATRADVAIAPSADGGTGGLLQRRGTRLPAAFGSGSATRHALGCLAARVPFEWCDLPGLRQDIDTPDDLLRLDVDRVGTATARLFEQPDFARLLARGGHCQAG